MTSPLSRREWWVLSFIGCAVLIAFALIYLAAPAHAQEDVEAIAAEAGVDPVDLLGAVLTTHMPARTYLIAVGELQPPQPILTVWDRLAECESGGNWSVHAYHHGGLQFLPSTWTAYKLPGYPAFAYQATRAQQIAVGQRVQAAAGLGAMAGVQSKVGTALMPLVNRPRNGLWLDDCAPHFGFKVWHALAILAGMVMWLVLIFTAVAIYRYMRGGA